MIVYGWQCPVCFLCSGQGFSKKRETDPNPDPPSCCGGEIMVPYRITPQEVKK